MRLDPSFDMRAYVTSLVGQELTTITGREDRVLEIRGDDVLVATERSPSGQPVPLADIQSAADQLSENGVVEINPLTVGYRSAFIGAVLSSLPNTVAHRAPARIALDR